MTESKPAPAPNPPPSPHVDRSDTGGTGQPVADGPPQGDVNTDPNTNSGYPAGGSQAQEGKDAFGRPTPPDARDKPAS
ncbi:MULTISPECIES: hypothetical protein [Achromobacter]|jgi:hypothetical protein|uniref:Uncharacterized protein n=1 Tax=Achromobacter kerstersii TaxID=1353890 RepID=A0A6S6Z6U2_9BURK|nr:hypothetical protein [Achromobacter kerstersii]CAB3657977.1 hypothetical protein LMG3441_00403 [Achromobacter kerstersii]CUJ67947.1 Uncharacterised protein [Achromobacter kerstersii]